MTWGWVLGFFCVQASIFGWGIWQGYRQAGSNYRHDHHVCVSRPKRESRPHRPPLPTPLNWLLRRFPPKGG
jgi:hypothetical protein